MSSSSDEPSSLRDTRNATNWRTALTSSGRPYYFHRITREVSWNPPQGYSHFRERLAECPPTDCPIAQKKARTQAGSVSSDPSQPCVTEEVPLQPTNMLAVNDTPAISSYSTTEKNSLEPLPPPKLSSIVTQSLPPLVSSKSVPLFPTIQATTIERKSMLLGRSSKRSPTIKSITITKSATPPPTQFSSCTSTSEFIATANSSNCLKVQHNPIFRSSSVAGSDITGILSGGGFPRARRNRKRSKNRRHTTEVHGILPGSLIKSPVSESDDNDDEQGSGEFDLCPDSSFAPFAESPSLLLLPSSSSECQSLIDSLPEPESIKSLCFTGKINESLFDIITPNLTGVTAIQFRSPSITDQVLLSCLDKFPRLQILGISNCNKITAETLFKFAPTLTQLFVSNCRFFTDSVLDSVVKMFSSLRAISIGRCPLSPSFPTILTKDLEFIDLSLSRKLSDIECIAIGKQCPQLRHLVLKRCAKITNSGIKKIASSCPLLESIHLAGLNRLTDHSVQYLAEGLPNLIYIDLNQCSGLTEIGISALVDACESIAYLDVRGCKISRLGLSRLKTRFTTGNRSGAKLIGDI